MLEERAMKARILVVFLMMLAIPICAPPQDAVVAEMSKEESAKASELYRRLTAAQAEWETFKDTIRDKYGPNLAKVVGESRRTMLMKGEGTEIPMPEEWAAGIEFSTDFRFALAKSKQ
ncbi:MAG: hypothetical protein DMG57_16015 [Acidobacteria bacterium]|nr:MAG: hypothetical protein DMG57_16015 [Acidobacteriota bacterium]